MLHPYSFAEKNIFGTAELDRGTKTSEYYIF